MSAADVLLLVLNAGVGARRLHVADDRTTSDVVTGERAPPHDLAQR
jgi:hypothetical protein